MFEGYIYSSRDLRDAFKGKGFKICVTKIYVVYLFLPIFSYLLLFSGKEREFAFKSIYRHTNVLFQCQE